jgi:SAM-dependent methyltransferase
MDHQKIEDPIKKCYSTWGSTYYNDFYTENASYPPVHRDMIKTLLCEANAQSVLEAGCGPASLLRYFADLHIELYGFDLTPEMLAEGKRVFQEMGLDPDRLWQGSVLDPASFRQPTGKNPPFDAAICTGVFPHIPADQDIRVIKYLHDAVPPGGLVIIEARNQFFSLFTLNRYSHQFFMNDLIRIEDLKKKAADKTPQLEKAMDQLTKQFRTDLPPIQKGKSGEPGYDEVLSRTHNPLVLKEQFENTGFKDVKILFYHFHCIPPMFSNEIKEFFLQESIAMEKNSSDWRGFFMASAFLLAGKRND